MRKLLNLGMALFVCVGLHAQSVVDIVVDSPDHETLEDLVILAELADDLSGDGPFTVFAPTDAAFDALPAWLVTQLTNDPTGELANVLRCFLDMSLDENVTRCLERSGGSARSWSNTRPPRTVLWRTTTAVLRSSLKDDELVLSIEDNTTAILRPVKEACPSPATVARTLSAAADGEIGLLGS